MRTAIISGTTCCLFAIACSADVEDPDPWILDENSGEPAAPGQPDPEQPDPEQPDPERPDPEQPDPDPFCFTSQTELAEVDSRDHDAHVIVNGDRVFVSGYIDGHPDADVLEWVDGALQLFARQAGSDDIPVDGTDQHIWSYDDGWFRRHALGEQPSAQIRGSANLSFNFDFAQPRRRASGENFAWIDEQALNYFVDGNRILTYSPADSQPWVGEEGVAWLGREDEQRKIHFTDPTGLDRETEFTDELTRWPVTLGHSVLFLQSGEVWAWNVDNSEMIRLIEDRICGPLHSDDQTAVLACTSGSAPPSLPGYLGISADEIWTIGADTLQTDRVYTTEGSEIYGPIVNDRWIAWLEHPSLADPDLQQTGEVMVLRRGADEPRAVARAHRGCWTCGAYWPPPRLDLGDDVLAFNYAVGVDSNQPSRPRYVGVVRLDDCD